MATRRATYSPGKGLLFVNADRLWFVTDADHAAVQPVAVAAQDEHPLRSLAAAVAGADDEIPPFVFVQLAEDLQGMVFGALDVELADPDSSLIRRDADDPLRHFRGSGRAAVSVGEDDPAALWVEVGLVCAGAFRWSAEEDAGEARAVAQPNLGTLRLSGGRVEPLDMDLLIGRNPAREPLEPNQRAVVHGQGDRSVSRRHIDLRLDGRQVVVTNLKADEHTILESRHGEATPLVPGVARALEVGDTVRYGGSWFRYEEGP